MLEYLKWHVMHMKLALVISLQLKDHLGVLDTTLPLYQLIYYIVSTCNYMWVIDHFNRHLNLDALGFQR